MERLWAYQDEPINERLKCVIRNGLNEGDV
jgi:hypothetical protein